MFQPLLQASFFPPPPVINAGRTKETTFESADFALQLLMFVTAEKEGQMFIIFYLPIFCRLLSPLF